MKYIAALLVAIGFYWYFVGSKPAEEPVAVETEVTRPGELSSVEKEYYIQVFDYTMGVIEGGKSYEWQGHNGNKGKISVEKPFQSKSSATCRNFSETFDIGGQKGKAEGIACKRNGDEGWCRLKKSDALTCALEQPNNIVTFDFPGVHYSTPGINVGTGGVQTPGISGPSVNTNVDTGNNSNKGAGKTYAETVTGTAGSAAGPVTKGLVGWFNETFRGK